MSDLFWLSDAQMRRLEPFIRQRVRKSHGRPRADGKRVRVGISINYDDLRWRDAPVEYGSHS